MNVNVLHTLTMHIATDMAALIDDKTRLASFPRKTCECCPEQTGSNYQVIILIKFLHCYFFDLCMNFISSYIRRRIPQESNRDNFSKSILEICRWKEIMVETVLADRLYHSIPHKPIVSIKVASSKNFVTFPSSLRLTVMTSLKVPSLSNISITLSAYMPTFFFVKLQSVTTKK